MDHPIEAHGAVIELQDVNWGVRLSNWLSRIACDLIQQNMVDKQLTLAKRVLEGLAAHGPVSARTALRQCRSLTAGDLDAAAVKLGYLIENRDSGNRGRPKKVYVPPTFSE
jgi:hypothetical protein